MTSRATPPSSRRSSILTSPPTTTRTAPSARATRPAAAAAAASRRTSIKGPPSSSLGPTPESLQVPSPALKHETDQIEQACARVDRSFPPLLTFSQLWVQLQNKDQTITTLTNENDNLVSSLSTAEARLNDLYADQARMEEEMAARIEVAEKLRTQVRELEKEKRDLQRRYNEQVPTPSHLPLMDIPLSHHALRHQLSKPNVKHFMTMNSISSPVFSLSPMPASR